MIQSKVPSCDVIRHTKEITVEENHSWAQQFDYRIKTQLLKFNDGLPQASLKHIRSDQITPILSHISCHHKCYIHCLPLYIVYQWSVKLSNITNHITCQNRQENWRYSMTDYYKSIVYSWCPKPKHSQAWCLCPSGKHEKFHAAASTLPSEINLKLLWPKYWFQLCLFVQSCLAIITWSSDPNVSKPHLHVN